MATPADVRKIALALENVAERPSYGTPAFFVRRKLFARLLEDGDSVVVKIDFDDRQRRVQANPRAFFVTDHYQKYPMMVVRLSEVDKQELRELLAAAHQFAGG